MRPITEGNHYILFNDTGISLVDMDYPKAINMGICETTMVGMACGLASEGHKVYVYAITPHHLRAWEFVRTLLVPGNYDVVLCGFGEVDDYASLGHSHQMDAEEMRYYCWGAKIKYKYIYDMRELTKCMRMRGPLFLHIPKKATK